MATDQRTDPYRAYNFVLEIDGVPKGAFSEVGGLTAEGDSVDYREGTDVQPNVRKLVAMRKFSNITLKRGYTADKSLWQWYTNIFNGVADRRNVTIVLMNERREPVLRWNAENAWINKIEGPALKASSNDVAMESLELVHEGLTLET
ncbi:phage tail protein [Variovorax sp. J22R24]|uniref:phage tail protein n=1 Tax=Variovorax gracilis TaxID=3053502 RepID=UPI0025763725|nr:phage tail protein [Variovorax sp. J22R24]MDM0109621.1 phage tail protein [Variovorax sp. J22R24]